MKLKLLIIGAIILTVVFAGLSFSNVYNSDRAWYESELEIAHQNLLDNLETQEKIKEYGNRYSGELSLLENAESAVRGWMWDCQRKIDEYDQKATTFGLLSGVFAILSVVVVIIKVKRKD